MCYRDVFLTNINPSAYRMDDPVWEWLRTKTLGAPFPSVFMDEEALRLSGYIGVYYCPENGDRVCLALETGFADSSVNLLETDIEYCRRILYEEYEREFGPRDAEGRLSF